MPRGKQFVFSARTTAEGLKTLNELKARLGVNWDSLIIDAINANYDVEIPKPALVSPTPEERAVAKTAKDAEKKAKADARADAAKAKAEAKAKAKKAAKIKKAADKAAEEPPGMAPGKAAPGLEAETGKEQRDER